MLRHLYGISTAWFRATARVTFTALLATASLVAHAGVAVASCPATTGPNYSGQDLTNHNFRSLPPGSLKGANFSHAILKGAEFSGQDLSGASFLEADLGPSTLGSADLSSTTLTSTCFSGATVNATDFTFANFHCTDFSNTSLLQALFGPTQFIVHDPTCRTSFAHSVIDYHAITPDHWSYVDFSYASFRNPAGKPFSLAGTDLTGAKLAGTDFTKVDFQGANLTDVDFTGAKLAYANLNNAALNGATLTSAQLHDATLNCVPFYGGQPNGCSGVPQTSDAHTAANLTSANLQRASLHNTVFDYVAMPGANLAGVDAPNSSFSNTALEANATVTYAANLQRANLTGANFTKAHLNFVLFANSTLTDAVFDGLTLKGTDFTGSVMPGASFRGAVLENVNFPQAILENADFTGATMKSENPGDGSLVNFSCAQLGGGNFQDAQVTAANFLAAVMPPASACCPQSGNKSFCGAVNVTPQAYGGVIHPKQLAYGGVTYPKLQAAVTCPDGDIANCNATQWEIPNWQTQVCSHGNSQTVWTKPDCNSPTGDQVQFKDPHLKACILATLPGNPSSISVAKASTLLEVSCPNLGISDLTGLENFTGLISLDLSGNQIRQFSEPMPNLGTLKLGSNQLTSLDLGKICINANCPLFTLDVSHNLLQSIGGAADFYPVVLDLSYNQLSSFDLPTFSTLVFADLSHNQLADVLGLYHKNLSQLASLNYLDLSYNAIPTIGDAGSIASSQTGALTSLYLACNPTFDCRSLNLPGTSAVMQNSQCAQFNAQSNQWIVQPHPSCPTAFKAAAVLPAR